VIYSIGDRRIETLGDFYIAPSADVIGSVRLGHEASVWFNVVLRGDNDWIVIGAGSNVQDLSVIHTDAGTPTVLGRGVTVGHRALLHNCTIEDECLIGNGAIVLDRVRVGSHSIVAAGALVPPDAVIPPDSVVMGSPGRVVRQSSERDLALIARGAQAYVSAQRLYRTGLRPEPPDT
jgi:carbonic anhydrase/acetyltransferase-like protein (isoleucine patch superfamily)